MADELNDSVWYPHSEVNEDGKRNEHPGYIYKMGLCGHMFLMAKTLGCIIDKTTTCGLENDNPG